MRRTAPHMRKRFAWTSQPPRFHASGFCRRSARISPTLGLADRWLREINGICSTWVLFHFFRKALALAGTSCRQLSILCSMIFIIHICNAHTHSMQERISETNCGTPPLNLVGPLPQLTLKKALGYRTVTAKQVSMLKAQDPVDTRLYTYFFTLSTTPPTTRSMIPTSIDSPDDNDIDLLARMIIV